MQVKAANNIALRLEFEEARLARFLRQMNLAATQGRWVDAEMLLYEARQVRCEIDGLQEQLCGAGTPWRVPLISVQFSKGHTALVSGQAVRDSSS